VQVVDAKPPYIRAWAHGRWGNASSRSPDSTRLAPNDVAASQRCSAALEVLTSAEGGVRSLAHEWVSGCSTRLCRLAMSYNKRLDAGKDGMAWEKA
jgi:hypothetical protein